MKRWSDWLGFGITGVLAAAALGMLVGCADDLYAPCDFDPASPDRAIQGCAAATTCAVKNQLQCDTRICARYGGSEPFCTTACTQDGDCPSGVCKEIPFQRGEFYCVEEGTFDAATL